MDAHSDEFARQRALDSYGIVDALPESAYEDIVRIATLICDVPSALISLLDRDRQWFMAREGFSLREGRREDAFCDHAIREPESLMEVQDATRDPRFADNPLVTDKDGPKIRFYAGVPLVTPGGAAIGTVCVLDSEPRMINEEQKKGLMSLARLTMNLLDTHRRQREHERTTMLEACILEQPAPAVLAPAPLTLGIFQIQSLAAIATKIGDRALGQMLVRLHELIEFQLQSGDSIDHSTGSAEMIVVLHGSERAATMGKLRECVAAFELEHGIRVLEGSTDSISPSERINALFLRADEVLSDAKDAFRGAH